jgi:Zn-dependent peptidase ImmA (M78 family)
VSFPHGFKSRCEALSLQLRHRLRIGPSDALPPETLAKYVGVTLWSLQELSRLSLEVRGRLEGDFKGEWSAVTIVAGPSPVIVFNSAHSRRRRASTLMHELSHVLLDHTPGNMFFGASGLALRTYDPAQESEADWLAGCLLLPREALLEARKRGVTDEELCGRYGVSGDMLRFRINATGVERQLGVGERRAPAVRRKA